MCGIVAGVSGQNIVPLLIDGLKRLEYRGYDSAGIALLQKGEILRLRAQGKVQSLEEKVREAKPSAHTGIAHTRWATHGIPSEINAHPHVSGKIALVHNGIIENYQLLREELQGAGFKFSSKTDTEVVAHLINFYYMKEQDFLTAVRKASQRLEGAYALAVICADRPDEVIGLRRGSPLVLGLSDSQGIFVASDIFALLAITRSYLTLEQGELVHVQGKGYQLYDSDGEKISRAPQESSQDGQMLTKGQYNHYMQKEIFEQPTAVADTLEGRLLHGKINRHAFGDELFNLLQRVRQLHIVACGTSYHAGCTAKYFIEELDIPVAVEVSSEYIYRSVAVPEDTLFICISQSGETADTISALAKAKELPYLATLAICNAPESSITQQADHVILTRAGREISVASSKAFTTQLVVLHLIKGLLAEAQGRPLTLTAFDNLPGAIQQVLAREEDIIRAAKNLANRSGCLFLGRGDLYPIALEGALKLKELTYMHAEAYAAGELKHGPMALIDEQMLAVGALKSDELSQKTLSNFQEVQARGGQFIIFYDGNLNLSSLPGHCKISLGDLDNQTAHISITVALQLLAYHTARLRGTDIDQPRNLAKSVTVE